MTEPAGPPPALELRRSEAQREDGRYVIYYTFDSTGETPVPPEETPPCPS